MMRPGTKDIALEYHYCRSYVKRKLVLITYIETGYQIADIFIKAVNDAQLYKPRKELNGW